MGELSYALRKKTEALLRFYGGLEGFSKNPPWLIQKVLETFFTEAERKQIMKFLFKELKKDVRAPVLRDMSMQ